MIANAKLEVLVDAHWIVDHMTDLGVRLVEVDVSPATYSKGHISGAVLWNAYGDLRDSAYRPVPRADFERILSRSGIAPDSTVVFYGYGAFLGFWLMKAYGHRDARMLNGGREDWERLGRLWSSEIPQPPATTYKLPVEDRGLLTSHSEVESALGDPTALLLDVRSDAEFRGERFWPSGVTEGAGRAGHIRGAVHVPIDRVRDESGMMKATEDLRRLYLEAGVSPDRKVITYCTIGNRAALTWFVLKYLLGYPHVSVYGGSYVEWGKLPASQIEAA